MKFSIIIPVYNPNNDLFNNCLDSISKQTYEDFEVIIVDDGSTNNCENIYNKFTKFKAFKINNSGVSNARNYGIRKSEGEWIVFVDADDTIPNNTLEIYNKHIKDNKYDLIIGNSNIIKENEIKSSYSKYNKDTLISQNETIKSILMTKEQGEVSFTYIGAVWGKCFKSKIIKDNNIRFTNDIVIGEDTLFNLDYILKCNDIFYTNSFLYNYFINSSSAMKKYSRKVFESSILLKKQMLKYENIIDKRYISYFNIRQLFNIFELYLFNSSNKNVSENNFDEIIKLYENDIKLIKSINVKKEYIILLFLLKYFRNFTIIKCYFKIINKMRTIKKKKK